MTTTDDTINTPQSLVNQLGENYEYIKTIATNNMEIKKLQTINLLGMVASKFILCSILFILFLLLTIVLTALCLIGLFNLLGSLVLALAVVSGSIAFIALLIYLFRRQIIYNKILRATDSIVDNALSEQFDFHN